MDSVISGYFLLSLLSFFGVLLIMLIRSINRAVKINKEDNIFPENYRKREFM